MSICSLRHIKSRVTNITFLPLKLLGSDASYTHTSPLIHATIGIPPYRSRNTATRYAATELRPQERSGKEIRQSRRTTRERSEVLWAGSQAAPRFAGRSQHDPATYNFGHTNTNTPARPKLSGRWISPKSSLRELSFVSVKTRSRPPDSPRGHVATPWM